MFQLIKSLIFIVSMYLAMLIMGIVFAPLAIYSRDGAYWAMKFYCRYVLWTARWMTGLRYEVRGEVPQGEVVVASKHQSFMDIILLMYLLPRAKFIMKQELKWAPVLGFYAWRIGSAPVNRGRKDKAMSQMLKGVEDGRDVAPGQTIIYPQGTRVPPGVKMRYKIGAGVLYERLALPCVPVATNVGVFWGKRSPMRHPGVAVMEFLSPIEQGLSVQDFVKEMEAVIEPASDALMREAGFVFPDGYDELEKGI
jgi:1-acyl-sn-glycerol-3-phosphate acyltransferase